MALPRSYTVDQNGLRYEVAELSVTGDFSVAGSLGVTKVDLDSTTATLSSNTATISKYAAVITTESLSTAHTASQDLTITLAGVAAGDLAFVQRAGGTSSAGVPLISAVCSTDTVTITLKNAATTTNAFNGTFILNLIVFKA